MKVYTRTGDGGTTSLVGGKRVPKSSLRLEAYGTVDELNSAIGLLLAMDGVPQATRQVLDTVQNHLFRLGSELATEPESKWQPKKMSDQDVAMLEGAIDAVEAELPRHNQFILPGGTMAAAQANVARTVARRCERRMVQMDQDGEAVAGPAMRYINRLSDYLFVVGRQINVASGVPEVFWDQGR